MLLKIASRPSRPTLKRCCPYYSIIIFFVPEDEDVYLNWIAKVAENKKTGSKMRSWRAEWKRLVGSGKDGEALPLWLI